MHKDASITTMGAAGRVISEVASLLFWSMLAATTIGPGSVITCSRAGAEEGLQLIWTLVFATAMAYTLQVRYSNL